MSFKKIMKGAIVGLAFAAALGAQTASAGTIFSFVRAVTPSGPGMLDLGSQFKMIVSEAPLGVVEFKFINSVGVPSSIVDIYFNSALNLLLGPVTAGPQSGTALVSPSTPPLILSSKSGWCEGETDTDACFTAGALNDANQYTNGLDSRSDFVTFYATLRNTGTFNSLIAALGTAKGPNVALFAAEGAFPGSLAVEYVLNPVPIPAAAWLFGSALLGFVGWSRRRKV